MIRKRINKFQVMRTAAIISIVLLIFFLNGCKKYNTSFQGVTYWNISYMELGDSIYLNNPDISSFHDLKNKPVIGVSWNHQSGVCRFVDHNWSHITMSAIMHNNKLVIKSKELKNLNGEYKINIEELILNTSQENVKELHQKMVLISPKNKIEMIRLDLIRSSLGK